MVDSTDFAQMRRVPILNNVSANEKEKQEQLKKEILSNPIAHNRLMAIAEILNESFNSSTKIVANIRTGARLRDNVTKVEYIYEYFAKSIKHDIHAQVVMDLAKKPFTDFSELPLDQSEFFAVVYDANANPAPRFIMSFLDFCKYIAAGIWTVIDFNNEEESQFLKKIDKGQ